VYSEVYSSIPEVTRLEAKIEGRQTSKKAAREEKKLVVLLHFHTLCRKS
jgi:hypothetical protein